MGAKAYFLTWTTYGTWLPGDSRGWVDRNRNHGEVVEFPDPDREANARQSMKQDSVILDTTLREVVRKDLLQIVAYRSWFVHALDVRSNHVHIIVTAQDKSPAEVMGILKSYTSRALNQSSSSHIKRWWTRQGSKRKLFTDEDVSAAVRYVRNQDTAWMKDQ